MTEQQTTAAGLRREWQAFWLAMGFLTRIPVPVTVDYSQRLMNQCSVYFPLVGLLLGGLYAGLYTLLAGFWSPQVCVLLVLGFHLWITGAFHEDGMADCADGLGGGYTVARRLEIMKDSRIGTYGAVALGVTLALKVALLTDMQPVWLALLLAPAISRLTPLCLMRALVYVSDPDTSKSKPVAEGFSGQRLGVAVAGVAALALVAGVALEALMAVVSVVLVWGAMLRRSLGGYTGDALGASVILSELVFLLMLVQGQEGRF
ncbi:adenosylcobinamide-GDP ribazoletransferase [Alcanivorax profundi]|uniref:Adenosylcobinamide-GDP ribazoletransferase n=1 Tax=Alcanivorax profundi TaxID=2338368 RepID=A0A418XZC8_9GAMM|nr:adenosylcobinamide-GDP ribazoletransferase [Alcanivorax profundi]RJG18363.1 adenosylcobinamide-GDP ribazoletransferase [Alcanivorax profundi]